MATIEINDTTAEKFFNFSKAHYDGDNDAAIDGLLFCHKVLTARMMKDAANEGKK